MAKATDRSEYMEMLWGSSQSNEGVFHNTVMDMAWSLHVIAEMLMEQRGYVNTDKYMCGKPEHEAEQTEPSINCSTCGYSPQTPSCDTCEGYSNWWALE